MDGVVTLHLEIDRYGHYPEGLADLVSIILTPFARSVPPKPFSGISNSGRNS
jgi:hypothetical protein